MDAFLEIIELDSSCIEAKDSADVVTAACEEWGFLATYVEDLEEKTEAAMKAFVEQLESSNLSVQISVGENIALLYEKSYTVREANDGAASEEEDDKGHLINTNMVKRYDVY
jgi:hypothetical protein